MKWILFLSLLTFFCLTCSKSDSPTQNENEPGIIEGRITDASTNDPITGVLISTQPSTKMPLTGSDGTFEITDIIQGSYKITAEKAGYISQTKNINVSEGSTLIVDFILVSDEQTDFPFRITAGKYVSTDNLENAVQNEFGSNYKLADWNDVVSFCNEKTAAQFIDLLGWSSGESNSLLISANNAQFWGLTNRHYYMTRFDHKPTQGYLSHKNIENHYIDLGSWDNITMKVLAVKKNNETNTAIINGKCIDALTGLGLENVEIKTQPSTETLHTDVNGQYTLFGVTPGTYQVTTKKDGYQVQNKEVVASTGMTVTADFSLDAIQTDFPFKITSQKYLNTVDLDQAIQNEFGNNYRLADWNDISQYCKANSATQFVTLLSWPTGESNSLLVTQDDLHYWGNTTRHFYITRFDHNPTTGYMSHANIENHLIDLGSWSNITMSVLVVSK